MRTERATGDEVSNEAGSTEVSIRHGALESISGIPGVGPEAAALVADAFMIDLHIDTFIPPRLIGYDLH